MFDMLNKLQEAKSAADDLKKKLDSISVKGEAEGGKVVVIATANKEVTSVSIDSQLIAGGDKEEIEELTRVAVNNALRQADNVSASESKGLLSGMLPNIPGL